MNRLNQRTLLRSIIVIGILVLGMYTVISTVFRDDGVVAKGKAAPDFTAENLDGEIVSLSDYRGKGVLLNFWGSWCELCNQEMPSMNEAYRAGIKNVEILAVNLREGKIAVDSYVNRNNIDFPVLLDPYGAIGKKYKIYHLPATFVIDKNGIVVEQVVGELPSAEYIRSLMEMVS